MLTTAALSIFGTYRALRADLNPSGIYADLEQTRIL